MGSTVLFEIFIKVNAKKTELHWDKDSKKFVAYVKSAPQKGKANKEVISLIKQFFKASEVRLVKGFSATTKVFEIIDAKEHKEELLKNNSD